jgi:ethanolamine utilization protein EutA
MDRVRRVVSVGIDIGTTTTQLVFSQLSLVELARAGQIPRMDIAERSILHESEIVLTPLLDAETIDAEALAGFLRGEYARAGLLPAEVETGAVIITGETARKKNAGLVLSAIAGLAGDFVVTVAGPKVEGMIAGRGSGAAAFSRSRFTTVANIDIGGGSANGAIFRLGEVAASAAMNFGGRVVELDGAVVTSITKAGEAILGSIGLRLVPGDRPSLADLRRLTEAMADLAICLIEGSTNPLAARLYQTPPLPSDGKLRNLMFSGGIGWYFYEPLALARVEEVSRHGDLGPLLAESLRLHPALARYTIQRPEETRRATVLGASAQTLSLSGSTIWADPSILPLKNLPVVRAAPGPLDAAGAPGLIAQALARWDLDPAADGFALALELEGGMDYSALTATARGLAAFTRGLPPARPFIVITKRDYAQALGQTLKGLDGDRPLLVIDQIGLEEGDYIDIGAPLMDGRVVPLVVKTLIFYH